MISMIQKFRVRLSAFDRLNLCPHCNLAAVEDYEYEQDQKSVIAYFKCTMCNIVFEIAIIEQVTTLSKK